MTTKKTTALPALTGTELSPAVLQGFRKVSDLIYFQGALLSHFKSPTGKDFLYQWCDTDETVNRWLVWNANAADLQSYANGQMSLRDLLLSEAVEELYAVEFNHEIEIVRVIAIDTADLPESYVPAADSYLQRTENV